MPDAISLLRDLRPGGDAFDPDSPASRAALERLLLAPPQRRPRRARRRLALAATATATAAVAVALSPLLSSSPDVVARAAAALDEPDTILHFTAAVRQRGSRSETRGRFPDAHVDRRAEVWRTAGGRQERVLIGGGLEFVEDWDTRTSLAYSAERDEVIRHTEPDIFDPARRVPSGLDAPSPLAGALNTTDDLARVLERARRGDAGVRMLGDTTVRGIAVHELRIDYTAQSVILPAGGRAGDPSGLPTETMHMSRLVYVDRETYLPVRVIDRTEQWVNAVTDYLEVERLPRTAANEQLLRMAPHPGARQVVEGRL